MAFEVAGDVVVVEAAAGVGVEELLVGEELVVAADVVAEAAEVGALLFGLFDAVGVAVGAPDVVVGEVVASKFGLAFGGVGPAVDVFVEGPDGAEEGGEWVVGWFVGLVEDVGDGGVGVVEGVVWVGGDGGVLAGGLVGGDGGVDGELGELVDDVVGGGGVEGVLFDG